jgi:hypothetical protein
MQRPLGHDLAGSCGGGDQFISATGLTEARQRESFGWRALAEHKSRHHLSDCWAVFESMAGTSAD